LGFNFPQICTACCRSLCAASLLLPAPAPLVASLALAQIAPLTVRTRARSTDSVPLPSRAAPGAAILSPSGHGGHGDCTGGRRKCPSSGSSPFLALSASKSSLQNQKSLGFSYYASQLVIEFSYYAQHVMLDTSIASSCRRPLPSILSQLWL
jgi:hypothetical protein